MSANTDHDAAIRDAATAGLEAARQMIATGEAQVLAGKEDVEKFSAILERLGEVPGGLNVGKAASDLVAAEAQAALTASDATAVASMMRLSRLIPGPGYRGHGPPAHGWLALEAVRACLASETGTVTRMTVIESAKARANSHRKGLGGPRLGDGTFKAAFFKLHSAVDDNGNVRTGNEPRFSILEATGIPAPGEGVAVRETYRLLPGALARIVDEGWFVEPEND